MAWIANHQKIDYIFVIKSLSMPEASSVSEHDSDNRLSPSLYPLRLKVVLYDAKTMKPLDVASMEGYPSVFNRDFSPLFEAIDRYFAKVVVR